MVRHWHKTFERRGSENNWQDRIDIEWYPFELNPDMPPEGENLRDHIIRKYGATPEESAENRQRLIEFGQSVGFEFNFTDDFRIYNTRQCHILLDYAHSVGLQTQLKIALFTAYFTEGKIFPTLMYSSILVKASA